MLVLFNPSSQGLDWVTSESLHLSLQASPYTVKLAGTLHYYLRAYNTYFHPCQIYQKDNRQHDNVIFFYSFIIGDVIAGVIKRLQNLKQVK